MWINGVLCSSETPELALGAGKLTMSSLNRAVAGERSSMEAPGSGIGPELMTAAEFGNQAQVRAVHCCATLCCFS